MAPALGHLLTCFLGGDHSGDSSWGCWGNTGCRVHLFVPQAVQANYTAGLQCWDHGAFSYLRNFWSGSSQLYSPCQLQKKGQSCIAPKSTGPQYPLHSETHCFTEERLIDPDGDQATCSSLPFQL